MSGMMGGGGASAGMDSALRTTQGVMDAYKNLTLPDIEQMKLYLDQYQSQGQLTPEEIQTMQQGDSRLSTISTDPRLRANYMNALEQLSGISQTGMTDIDRAAMADMLRQAGAQQQAQQKQILEQRAARGMGGSGDELAAALAASQSGANQTNANALQIAAQAMQNRLGALNSSSDMARAIEQSDYNRAASSAQAQDAINQFNTQLAANTLASNVQARNAAQQANLQQAQQIANANVDTRNQQQQYNKELQQQQYQNQLHRLAGMSGQAANVANLQMAQGQAQSDQRAQLGRGLGTLVGAGIGYGTTGTAKGATVGSELGRAAGGILF